ncbi:MAG: ABC transporter substrate-binding protein [Candidatus Hodarchaeales archaeon]
MSSILALYMFFGEKNKMKISKSLFGILVTAVFFIASFSLAGMPVKAATTVENFEIIVPWGLDHERGQIIASMIDNHSTLGTKYNYTFTQVGGGPSDRDGLVARFLAGDYPDLILCTQDWYTEFAQFGIWHDFDPTISAWTGDKATWREDIPDGWWSILDKEKGDGTGSGIYALPFFGQSIIPYINLDHFGAVGLTAADVDTIDGMLSACETLDAAGYTPFALVGLLQSDLAYMNYMMGSTDDFISSATDPATVISWDSGHELGINGSLSVEGFAAYMKIKGEGWCKSTVDTDGGGEANTLFGQGNASMVFCGPWGTSIFEGHGLTNFTAIPMFKSSNGERSTITGGGISFVPNVGGDSAKIADAVALAEWLLDDENQMKTVDNWLGTAWRIPVRESLKSNTWFTAHENRSNFVTHIESQAYAYPWGKQHPSWMDIHENVMMPGYRAAMLDVDYGAGYTDAQYTAMAQAALDEMAYQAQTYYLGGLYIPPKASPGFELGYVFIVFGLLAIIPAIRRKK